MNQIGDNLGGVTVDRKQELDGSLVVCAKQRTIIRRTSVFNQQLLTCELLTNNRHHSMFSSFIVIKGNRYLIRSEIRKQLLCIFY